MSTISEALKKAQKRRLENGPGQDRPAAHDAPVPRSGQDDRRPEAVPDAANAPLTGIIVAVLVVCLVCFIAWSRWPHGAVKTPSETFQMAHPQPAAPAAPVAVVVPEAAPAVVPVPAAPVTAAVVVVTQAVPVAAAPVVAPPPAKPVAPPANLPVLNGVFYSEQNPVAMLNGSALKEGEDIDGYKVVRILARGVILKSQEGEFELKVK